MRLELKPAHDAAFQEDISTICTNRLWLIVLACFKVPLTVPTMGVWQLGWWVGDTRRRTFWQWLTRTKPELPARLLVPEAWEPYSFFDYAGPIGRKHRTLVVRLSLKWKEVGEGHKGYVFFSTNLEVKQEGHSRRFMVFNTGVEIFPLTPQQAAFVGAKNLRSNTQHTIYWGTKEDVLEIQDKFLIAPSK